MSFSRNKVKKLVIATVAIPLLGAAVFVSGPVRAAGVPADDVAAVYKAKCAGCHSADGSGDTVVGKKLEVKDLRSADVQQQTDEQLYEVIAKGKGKMPGYEKSLGADKCKELVAYIRTLK